MGKNQAKNIRGVRALMAVASLVAALGFGAVMQQFFYPAMPSSATTTSGAEVGLNIKDFIKVAVDTSELALADGSGNTSITPEPTGTLITGDVNVAVTTNTPLGYALSVYTEDGSTSMVHSDTSVTNEIESIDTISGYDATTGVSTLSNNTWGFRKRTTSGLSKWYAVGENEDNGTVLANTDTGSPAYCEALSYPLESSGCDAGSYETHAVNFGAKLTSELPSGTYTNNVVFSAVAKSEGTRYTLNFNPNGGDNTMGPRTIVKGSTMTLPTKGFVKEGFAIKGWALTQEDAEIATENNISGTTNPSTTPTNPIYSAGQTIEVTDLLLAAIEAGQAVEQNALINLYAIWGNQFTLTLANNNTTAINTLNPTAGTHVYTLGDNVTVTCTPNSGYHCTEWISSNTDILPSKTGNTEAGDYTYTFSMPANDITLTANGTPNTFTINYNSNGGSGTTESTTVTYGSNVTLSTNNFTAPSGKKFKEWNTSDNGSGTTYTSGQSGIAPTTLKSDITTTNGGSITLYAIWEDDAVYMQNWTGCSSLSTNATIELTDNRDNNKYYVKKLPDGKCWMIENLTLFKATLTPQDTNISDGRTYYLPDKNTRYATADPFNSSNTTINSSILSASDSVNFDSSKSNQVQVGYRAQGTTDNNTGNPVPEDTAYYNFYTATLGFSYYGDGKTSGSSTQDICPKGWHLPWTSDSGGSIKNGNAEFYKLGLAYNGNSSAWTNYIAPGSTGSNTPYTSNATVRQNMVAGDSGSLDRFANNNGAAGFTYAGRYGGTSLYTVGTDGFYWSSSVYSSDYGYYLRFGPNMVVYSQSDSSKLNGSPVRCVANETMQNFDGSDMKQGQIKALTDTRDGEVYHVKKLPDGKVWMIDNLTTAGVALTPEDTNISDGRTYYLPNKNTRYTTSDPFNSSNTTISSNILSAGDSVDFGSSYSNQVQVGYRAQETTDNSTGNAVPEDTAYYNFYTATLGFSYYSDGKTSGSSAQDICPKGWHLPWSSDSGSTRTTTAEFYVLADSYNTNASWTNKPTGSSTGNPYTSDATIHQNMVAGDSGSLDRFANNGAAGFTYAGYYNGTSLNSVGTNGYYLSSSVGSTNLGYNLSLGTTSVYPQGNNNKYFGFSVRCVAGS